MTLLGDAVCPGADKQNHVVLSASYWRPGLSHIAQVRPPMPAVFFFVLDVTAGAVSSGMLAVACETIKGALDTLPGGERTHVGFLTFDSHLHYYNLSETRQPSSCLLTLLHKAASESVACSAHI